MTECTHRARGELTPEQWRGVYPPDTSVPQGKALPFLFPQERGQTSVSPEKELDDFISPEPFPQRKRPGSPVILSLLLRFLCGNCRENRSAEQQHLPTCKEHDHDAEGHSCRGSGTIQPGSMQDAFCTHVLLHSCALTHRHVQARSTHRNSHLQ